MLQKRFSSAAGLKQVCIIHRVCEYHQLTFMPTFWLCVFDWLCMLLYVYPLVTSVYLICSDQVNVSRLHYHLHITCTRVTFMSKEQGYLILSLIVFPILHLSNSHDTSVFLRLPSGCSCSCTMCILHQLNHIGLSVCLPQIPIQ